LQLRIFKVWISVCRKGWKNTNKRLFIHRGQQCMQVFCLSIVTWFGQMVRGRHCKTPYAYVAYGFDALLVSSRIYILRLVSILGWQRRFTGVDITTELYSRHNMNLQWPWVNSNTALFWGSANSSPWLKLRQNSSWR
jgi:hypothetical protein